MSKTILLASERIPCVPTYLPIIGLPKVPPTTISSPSLLSRSIPLLRIHGKNSCMPLPGLSLPDVPIAMQSRYNHTIYKQDPRFTVHTKRREIPNAPMYSTADQHVDPTGPTITQAIDEGARELQV
jgi:hypothetical protein